MGRRPSTRRSEIHPDLIVMDLSLPVMDGWEATRRLKANPQTRRIPVLALHRPRAGRPRARGERGRLRRLCRHALPPEDLTARIQDMLVEHRKNGGREASEGTVAKTRKTRSAARGRTTRGEGGISAGDADGQAAARPRKAGEVRSTASSARAGPAVRAHLRIGAEPSGGADRQSRGYRRRLLGHAGGDLLTPRGRTSSPTSGVNEAVMRQHTVIPMSFGTVFKTRDDIVELLRGAYGAFSDVLAKMAGQARVRPQGALGPRRHHPGDRARGRGHPAPQEGDLLPEGLHLLRRGCSTAASWTPRCRRAPSGAWPTSSTQLRARVGGLARQQAHRREDDHERRLPGGPEPGGGLRHHRSRRSARPVREHDLQVHGAMAAL